MAQIRKRENLLSLRANRGLVGGDRAPTLLLDFTTGSLPAGMTFSRSTTATDLLYTSATATYNSYSSNVPRFFGADGVLVEESRTQYLLNNATPVDQTVTLTTGRYCLWMIGSGSAAISAGTAIGTGFGTATQGVPVIMNVTTGGTVSVALTGTVNVFQLENGPGPSSFIPTTGSSTTRGVDLYTKNMNGIWNYVSGTFMMEFKYLSGGALQNNNHLDGITTGTGGCLFAFFHNYDLVQSSGLVGDGTVVGANLIYSRQAAFNVWHKIAGCYGFPTGQQMALDGYPTETSARGGATSSNNTLGSITLFYENNSKEGGSGLIRSWKYWNTQIADAALQALTV